MTKTAWVFPGQGSQTIGMEADLAEITEAKSKLDQAKTILGWSVLDICQSDEDTLSQTVYTQPCLYVIEAILADLLQSHRGKPDLAAGHSLGEYVALYTARVFDFATGLKLVKTRSQLMNEAAGGKMAALIKFDRQQLEDVVAATADVTIANDNSPAQVVISGTPEAVDRVLTQVKTKRAVPLKVSGAFHSPLMEKAAAKFKMELDQVEFADATIPVLSNIAPTDPTTDGKTLQQRLSEQITGSVRWREISLQLPKLGIEQVIEVGPGKVLTGLIGRTCKDLTLKNVASAASMESI